MLDVEEDRRCSAEPSPTTALHAGGEQKQIPLIRGLVRGHKSIRSCQLAVDRSPPEAIVEQELKHEFSQPRQGKPAAEIEIGTVREWARVVFGGATPPEQVARRPSSPLPFAGRGRFRSLEDVRGESTNWAVRPIPLSFATTLAGANPGPRRGLGRPGEPAADAVHQELAAADPGGVAVRGAGGVGAGGAGGPRAERGGVQEGDEEAEEAGVQPAVPPAASVEARPLRRQDQRRQRRGGEGRQEGLHRLLGSVHGERAGPGDAVQSHVPQRLLDPVGEEPGEVPGVQVRVVREEGQRTGSKQQL